jgi:hypothetical protein
MLIFGKDFTKWNRLDLEAPGDQSLSETDPARRKDAERQTYNDLRKPIQQLICDVHEEASTPNRSVEGSLLHATKRMVSMMGRVALAHERSTNILIWLTVVIAVLTCVLLALTIVLVSKGH